MNSPIRCLYALVFLCGLNSRSVAAEDARVYELRTYTVVPGKLEALLARFRDHTCKLFEKHGMTNVGYWTPVEGSDGSGEKLIYLLSHASRDAAKGSWAAFSKDPEWQAVRKASEADGKILAKAPEAIFLRATDYSPAPVIQAGVTPRVFELRTYTTPEGKLDALDARFRDHTRALFERHGMTNVVYLHPLDVESGAGNTLVYFLAHANRHAAAESWKDFRADPDWQKARAASEQREGGSLTTAGGVTSVFHTPTDFSPLK